MVEERVGEEKNRSKRRDEMKGDRREEIENYF